MLRTEHARPVRTSELRWRDDELRRGQPQRRSLGGVDDHADDRFPVGGGREAQSHRLPGCLGMQIPAPPRRPLHPDLRDDDFTDRGGLVQRKIICAQGSPGGAGFEKMRRPRGAFLVQHVGRPSTPFLGQVSEGADFFRGTGGEGRLLAQPDDRRL